MQWQGEREAVSAAAPSVADFSNSILGICVKVCFTLGSQCSSKQMP